ncbi:nuclease-related domain-containing protein [Rippkaea orientalis]|uniref:nuclease-related domain-containing protein n=1 Tax=Rippkaea orientalis TaxID=2546366 RepID=UPI0001726538|nr:nuclease-related domain-containing protein [Rippkaea orientalis]
MESTSRSEEEIFNNLSELCSSPGYIHVIAFFSYKDNVISYNETLEVEDMLRQFSRHRLVRTEISTLIGLLIKQKIDWSLPSPEVFQSMIDKTISLLEEIHVSMYGNFFSNLDPQQIQEEGFNPFANATTLREPIFYGSESAYLFQYKDLLEKKYAKDIDWFLNNKGYTPNDVRHVTDCIIKIQNDKLLETLKNFSQKHPSNWTLLPGFCFTTHEISSRLTSIEEKSVKSILDSFSILSDRKNNESFKSLGDFNRSNAYPIIKYGEDQYLLFQVYSLAEAYYETPFFWFNEDKSYKNLAMKHRGDFTEEFAKERLQLVFGKENVLSNIDIFDNKENKAGEIDVLVVFANRAIILQAKSKKLTLASRKGNDKCLKDDFKKAIQDSYNQGYTCAGLINNKSYRLCVSDSEEQLVNRDFKEIYIFCVVSDHYPALSFQARQFLKYHQTKKILPPFVMDVFLLDVMTEMLQSPLQFLNYINRRVLYGERILASNELTILSYHLKNNLWISNEYDLFTLDDNISTDLDLAMTVRRTELKGNETPDGILTRFQETTVGKLIAQIEHLEVPITIDLGFMLLHLNEETLYQISNRHLHNLIK